MHSNLHLVWRRLRETLRPHHGPSGDDGPRSHAADTHALKRVADVMTRNPSTLALTDTMDRAARLMWEADCGVLPVVDANERVVGMLTDRDICMAAYTQGVALWQIPASTAASRDIVALQANDTVETAHELMRRHRVRRLPVIDGDGRAVGIVSLGDLARDARAGESEGRGPTMERVAATLEAICVPPDRAVAE